MAPQPCSRPQPVCARRVQPQHRAHGTERGDKLNWKPLCIVRKAKHSLPPPSRGHTYLFRGPASGANSVWCHTPSAPTCPSLCASDATFCAAAFNERPRCVESRLPACVLASMLRCARVQAGVVPDALVVERTRATRSGTPTSPTEYTLCALRTHPVLTLRHEPVRPHTTHNVHTATNSNRGHGHSCRCLTGLGVAIQAGPGQHVRRHPRGAGWAPQSYVGHVWARSEPCACRCETAAKKIYCER